MMKRIVVAGLVLCAVSTAFTPRARAGADMVIDNSAQAPAYNYAPPPAAYYVPPPPVVIYRPYAYYRPVRVVGYRHWYGHRGYWPHGHRW